MWENTTPSTEFPLTFVPGSARCSSALCLLLLHVKMLNAEYLIKHKNIEKMLKAAPVAPVSMHFFQYLVTDMSTHHISQLDLEIYQDKMYQNCFNAWPSMGLSTWIYV